MPKLDRAHISRRDSSRLDSHSMYHNSPRESNNIGFRIIGDPSRALNNVRGQPSFQLPPDWSGLPMSLFPIPGHATIGPSRTRAPVILYALHGQGRRRYHIDGKSLHLRTEPGMLEIYGSDFGWEKATWNGSHGVCVAISFPEPLVRKILHTGMNFDLRTSHEVFHSKIRWLILELLSEAQSDEPQCPTYVESLTTALICLVDKSYGIEASPAAPTSAFSQCLKQRIMTYIDENLATDLSLDVMASQAFLSKYHFSRRFVATFGTSPHQYILQVRLKKSHTLLTTTSLPISEIAAAVGFGNQSTFSSAYRRYMGRTPSSSRWAPVLA
jgi:AraC family transcriptional regulator